MRKARGIGHAKQVLQSTGAAPRTQATKEALEELVNEHVADDLRDQTTAEAKRLMLKAWRKAPPPSSARCDDDLHKQALQPSRGQAE